MGVGVGEGTGMKTDGSARTHTQAVSSAPGLLSLKPEASSPLSWYPVQQGPC